MKQIWKIYKIIKVKNNSNFFPPRLYGNYEALQNGFTTKALQDLTGGIVQSFSLNSQVSNYLGDLTKISPHLELGKGGK